VGSVKVRDGRASAVVSGSMLDLARDLPRLVAPRVVDAFERVASTALDDARPVWPVESGRSLAGLYYDTALTTNQIKTVARDREDYTYKIRFGKYSKADISRMIAQVRARPIRKGFGEYHREKLIRWLEQYRPAPEGLEGKSPFHELIRKPIQRAERALATEISADLTALVERS